MPLPTPRLGLVVQYGFIWATAGRATPPDAGKDRPCLIVGLEDVTEPPARPGSTPRITTRVRYLPISHVSPRGAEQAIAMPPAIAKHLGLTSETSYLYLSYAVEDDWPYDLTHIPGSTIDFHYGFVPPKWFLSIAAHFEAELTTNPRLLHRP